MAVPGSAEGAAGFVVTVSSGGVAAPGAVESIFWPSHIQRGRGRRTDARWWRDAGWMLMLGGCSALMDALEGLYARTTAWTVARPER
eukprot:SAG31_NODE_41_length_31342_cov_8.029286_29_plen_87_part_00